MCPGIALKLFFGVFQNCSKTILKQFVFFSRMVGVYRRKPTKIAPTFIHKYVSTVIMKDFLKFGELFGRVLGEFGRVAHVHMSLAN